MCASDICQRLVMTTLCNFARRRDFATNPAVHLFGASMEVVLVIARSRLNSQVSYIRFSRLLPYRSLQLGVTEACGLYFMSLVSVSQGHLPVYMYIYLFIYFY